MRDGDVNGDVVGAVHPWVHRQFEVEGGLATRLQGCRPGEGEGPGTSPTPGPSPGKKLAGEVKGAGDEKPDQNAQNAQVAEAEPEKDGQMSEKQAELLLQSMKDEERRVQLDERKVARHVYNDW